MKVRLLFYAGIIFAYLISIVIAYFVSAVLPTTAHDTAGAGMETGFRFFLFALCAVIAVCAVSFIVSRNVFSSFKPAAVINGFIFGFIFLLITGFIMRG
ncbi:hypothetical protein H0R92_02370 [Treponema sp. OMZ 840]|uniref:hypothetical protein n=1 Tax=Treponema sp. OMZ 840 TaxID=244313 RepID=UPI003D8F0989